MSGWTTVFMRMQYSQSQDVLKLLCSIPQGIEAAWRKPAFSGFRSREPGPPGRADAAITYFCFIFKLRLMAIQEQRKDSGLGPLGKIEIGELQASHQN